MVRSDVYSSILPTGFPAKVGLAVVVTSQRAELRTWPLAVHGFSADMQIKLLQRLWHLLERRMYD